MSKPMRWIPEAFSMLIEMKVSTDNLNAFLLDDELSNEDRSQLETTKYEMVTKACALDKDIYNFSHGDLTERSGMRMRSALIMAIYRKQLKLSGLAKRRHSTGKIVNYVAVNAYRMTESMYWFLNIHFAKTYNKCQSLFKVAQGERLRAMSIAPLDAATIFTILATLISMSEPLEWIPEAFSMLIEMKISMDHLNAFLLDDELSNKELKSLEHSSDTCAKIKGNFSWEPELVVPTLRDISLEVKSKQKIAICGQESIVVLEYVFHSIKNKSSFKMQSSGKMNQTKLGKANIFSWLSFSWINSLLWLGYSKPLVLEDIPTLLSEDEAQSAYTKFSTIWEFLLRGDGNSNNPKNLLLKALFRVHWKEMIFAVVCALLRTLDVVTSPLLLNAFVKYSINEHKTRLGGLLLVRYLVVSLSAISGLGLGLVLIIGFLNIHFAKTYNKFKCKWNNCIYFSSILDISGTIRDNILFGKPTEKTKYEMVTKACALDKHIYNFNHLDLTKPRHDLARHNHMGFVDGEMSFLQSDGFQMDGQESMGFQIESQSESRETETRSLRSILENLKGMIGVDGYPFRFMENGEFDRSMIMQPSVPINNLKLRATVSYWLALAMWFSKVNNAMLIGVYAGISTFSIPFVYLRNLFATLLGLKASNTFFSGINNSIFKASMFFFDSTPVARIFAQLVDTDASLFFHSNAAMEWLVLRIETLQNLIILTDALLIVLLPGKHLPGNYYDP
ncbi:hypothetical protein EZV62_019433 [Acer yangbiense]|uniref:ABC transmembrane type-1 domain-containing protein n=1 Tax=Acer yangbiense TaxID=1000413 RepID=A0A5C7HB89_9ROSI|nr:hypothetical protein EZV62_019433 [Acer yangbiense]